MTKKPEWTFPNLPPALAGLTLEHLVRLRALIRDHGMHLGRAPQGPVHCLKVLEPVRVCLIVVGSAENAPLIVAPSDDLAADDHMTVGFSAYGEIKLHWSPQIALADVLACLDADAVMKTSQLKRISKHGSD